MSVNNRPQHSTFILSTTYTLSFTPIVYKSYNINPNQMTIKSNHHNPQLLRIPPKPTIYFLNLIMTTLCSSVMIIIVHKNTNYYCNPFIIFIMYVLSQITAVYIIYTQHFIKLLLYSCLNLFPTYNTNIVQYSIVYCYTKYPYHLIFIVILVYHTILAEIRLQIKSLFISLQMQRGCFVP